MLAALLVLGAPDVERRERRRERREGRCERHDVTIPEHCKRFSETIDFPHKIVPASWAGESWPMAIYAENDVVSDSICVHGAFDNIQQTLLAVKQVPGSNFLDVGGNIGWYTLVMAAHGIMTHYVEPNEKNRKLLELSLCMNPKMAAKVRIVPFALGPKAKRCGMYTPGLGHTNQGNTLAICDGDDHPAHFNHLVSAMEIRTLDELVSSRIIDLGFESGKTVMKIDTEGYEKRTFDGAKEFMTGPLAPRLIHSEFYPDMLKIHGPETATQYLEMVHQLGYRILEANGAEVTDFKGAATKYVPFTDLNFVKALATVEQA